MPSWIPLSVHREGLRETFLWWNSLDKSPEGHKQMFLLYSTLRLWAKRLCLVTCPNHTQHRTWRSMCSKWGGSLCRKRGHQTCFKLMACEAVVRRASPLMLISLNCDVFALSRKLPTLTEKEVAQSQSIKVLSKNSAESLPHVRTCSRCDLVPTPHNPSLSLQEGTARSSVRSLYRQEGCMLSWSYLAICRTLTMNCPRADTVSFFIYIYSQIPAKSMTITSA